MDCADLDCNNESGGFEMCEYASEVTCDDGLR